MGKRIKCNYCEYTCIDQSMLDVHVSRYHELLLAATATGIITTRKALQAPQTGATLERLYGSDYVICRQCLRPCVARSTIGHPDHDTCHNLYWLRSSWRRDVKAEIIRISLAKGHEPPNLDTISRERLARILKYKISAEVPETV